MVPESLPHVRTNSSPLPDSLDIRNEKKGNEAPAMIAAKENTTAVPTQKVCSLPFVSLIRTTEAVANKTAKSSSAISVFHDSSTESAAAAAATPAKNAMMPRIENRPSIHPVYSTARAAAKRMISK